MAFQHPVCEIAVRQSRVISLDRERKRRLLQAVHRALAEARMALAEARQVAR